MSLSVENWAMPSPILAMMAASFRPLASAAAGRQAVGLAAAAVCRGSDGETWNNNEIDIRAFYLDDNHGIYELAL
jgi:hypothetical protein